MNDAAKHPALNPLRAILAATRTGHAIDPHALIAAVGSAVASGADVTDALRAFEPYALIFVSRLGGADGAYMVRHALATGGMRAAIRMASLLGWTDVWAAAMTAHYGPTGIHASRLGPDGRPTAETLAECPTVGPTMAEAAERFQSRLGWYERNLGGTRWEQVVSARPVSMKEAA